MDTNTNSSSSTTSPVLALHHPLSIKLSDENYLIWRQQILATVRGHGLEGFLLGSDIPPSPFLTTDDDDASKQPNPAYLAWHRQDQLLSAWIQGSLSESSMILVVGLSTSKDIWQAIESSYASQSKAKIMQYKLQLQTIKRHNLPMNDYLNKVKSCCDILSSAGCHVSPEDHILYLLAGLDPEYDPVMVTITSRTESWSVPDVTALLLSFESRLETARLSSFNTDGSQPLANFVHAGSGPPSRSCPRSCSSCSSSRLPSTFSPQTTSPSTCLFLFSFRD